MAKWKLLQERTALNGKVDFYDTGKSFESDDPHGYVTQLQEKEGGSYAAAAAPGGILAAVGGIGNRIAHAVRRKA